ncbi:MAG: hypothetical protein ACO3DY_05880 [Candidatus Nanopelagicaceae bacterium]
MTDLERLQAYDEELSKVMPKDYKDWWQNSKDEWPLVARLVIENLEKDREWCYETIDIMSKKIEELKEKLK